MSKRIGLNVALGLNTSAFSSNLDKARGNIRRFGQDVKRQNELLSKFGASGLGRGFGIAGGALEAISMGGAAGGLGALAVGVGGIAMAFKGFMSTMDGLNKAAGDARNTMKDVASGNVGAGMLSGFTPLAAKAVTTRTQTDVFSETLASNLAPRTIEDSMTSYLTSAAPNVWRAWAAESINVMMDAVTGRGVGDISDRFQAAGFAAVAGDFSTDTAMRAAEQLQQARLGTKYAKETAQAMKGT